MRTIFLPLLCGTTLFLFGCQHEELVVPNSSDVKNVTSLHKDIIPLYASRSYRPSITVSNSWTVVPSGEAHLAIDEPSQNVSDYVQAIGASQLQCKIRFQDFPYSNWKVETWKVHVYCRKTGDGTLGTPKLRIWYSLSQYVEWSFTPQETWTELVWTLSSTEKENLAGGFNDENCTIEFNGASYGTGLQVSTLWFEQDHYVFGIGNTGSGTTYPNQSTTLSFPVTIGSSVNAVLVDVAGSGTTLSTVSEVKLSGGSLPSTLYLSGLEQDYRSYSGNPYEFLHAWEYHNGSFITAGTCTLTVTVSSATYLSAAYATLVNANVTTPFPYKNSWTSAAASGTGSIDMGGASYNLFFCFHFGNQDLTPTTSSTAYLRESRLMYPGTNRYQTFYADTLGSSSQIFSSSSGTTSDPLLLQWIQAAY